MEQAHGTSTSCNTMQEVREGTHVMEMGNKYAKGFKRRGYFITFWISNYPKALPKSAQYLCTCEDETKQKQFHGHAFIYYKNPVAISTIKKLFGNNCHVMTPKCNSDCIAYVLNHDEPKKHDFHEYGVKPMDNGVKRMNEVLECDSITEVMEKLPDTYVKYRNGIKDLMQNKKSKNRFFKPPEVIWIYGSTGKGKTREAFEAGAINVNYANGFFSDWGDARIICIEELRGEIPYATLLQLLDAYHNYYHVNIKGGSKLIDLDCIYITSPLRPEACYPRQLQKQDSINQLLRRITKIKNADSGKFENKDLKFYPEPKWDQGSIDLEETIVDAVQES